MLSKFLRGLFGHDSNRRRLTYAGCDAPAMICVAGSQLLETRRLCAQVVDVDLGSVMVESAPLQTNDIRGVAVSNGIAHVVGNDGGVGQRELFNLGTGVLSGPEVFWSQHLAQNGGTGGNGSSEAFGAIRLQDSSVVYLGSSANGSGLNATPTFWFDPRQPQAAAGLSNGGELVAGSVTGIIAGGLNGSSGVGSIGTLMTALPGGLPGGTILAASADGNYLVGNEGIYRQTAAGTTDYQKISTSGWQQPTDMLEFPSSFLGVAKVGSSYYAAAEYTTGEEFSFESKVGVWNIETGQLLYRTEAGDRFADLDEVEGQLVLGVNGFEGGALYKGTGGIRDDLSDNLDSTIDTIARGGIAGGNELVLAVSIDGQSRVVQIDFKAPPTEAVLPATTAIHQGLYPADVVSTSGAPLEIAIRGTADLDVRSIVRSSIFIGDVRGSTSGRVLSISYSDVNRDGFRDAIIQVQAKTALRTDTISLRITFSTSNGTKYDGTRAVESTSLGFLQYWMQDQGRQWARMYLQYIRTELRFWWT